MTATELATTLVERQRARRLEAHSRPWQPVYTPATALGYECERRTVYQRTGAVAAPLDPELASIFEEGNAHQADVRRELSALGYEVVEAEQNFRDERLEISGTIDGKLALPSENGHRPVRVPVEIKSVSGTAPPTLDALLASDGLMRRYHAQLVAYLLLTNSPEGLLLCKSKITGLWTILVVPLDYEIGERLFQRAERIRDAVRAWKAAATDEAREVALPQRIADRSECRGCPFRETVCHPGDAPIDPLLLAQDATLFVQVRDHEAFKPAAKRYDELHNAIRDRFAMTKGDRFIVGGATGWLVTKKITKAGQMRLSIDALTGNETANG